MIKVDFREPDADEWRAWKESAERKTRELVARYAASGDCEIEDRIYKAMRQVIFDAFGGKCAYCERKFTLDQTGDVEHFRPKKGVVDEHDRPVKIETDNGERDHPGYYWLAYDWRNLLPSCSRCNRLSRTRDGRLVGKGARFPVLGFRAQSPGEEAQERPVFLHPVFDDPQQHLALDENTGILYAKTSRGQSCIDLLDLNREGMPEERRMRYLGFQALLCGLLAAVHHHQDEDVRHTLRLMRAYKAGQAEFACVGRQALLVHRGELLLLQEYFEALSISVQVDG